MEAANRSRNLTTPEYREAVRQAANDITIFQAGLGGGRGHGHQVSSGRVPLSSPLPNLPAILSRGPA